MPEKLSPARKDPEADPQQGKDLPVLHTGAELVARAFGLDLNNPSENNIEEE